MSLSTRQLKDTFFPYALAQPNGFCLPEWLLHPDMGGGFKVDLFTLLPHAFVSIAPGRVLTTGDTLVAVGLLTCKEDVFLLKHWLEQLNRPIQQDGDTLWEQLVAGLPDTEQAHFLAMRQAVARVQPRLRERGTPPDLSCLMAGSAVAGVHRRLMGGYREVSRMMGRKPDLGGFVADYTAAMDRQYL